MAEEQKKQIQKKIMVISIGIMVLAVVFLVALGMTETADTLLLPVGLSVFLAAYWFVSDVLSVIWLKSFEGKTDEQKRAYYTYALIEAAGFAGLIYFIVDLRGTTGALIFAVSIFLKRRFRDEFQGVSEDGEAGAGESQPEDGEQAEPSLPGDDVQAGESQPEDGTKQ